MSATNSLPAGFATLEPYVAFWAAETLAERAQRRSDSNAAQRQAFFDAAAPLLEAALDYLDARPLAQFDASERRLLNLMLSLGHVQMAVEVHREQEPRHAASREAMRVTRSVTDLAPAAA